VWEQLPGAETLVGYGIDCMSVMGRLPGARTLVGCGTEDTVGLD